MKNYLHKILGLNIKEKTFEIPKNFPLYLKNEYEYEVIIIDSVKCLFVKPKEFDFVTCKKHIKNISQLAGLNVVLALDGVTPYQRKALIEQHIPFVVKDYQLYIPFLAINLTEKFQEKNEIEKFSPMTQLVFLYLFYNKSKITATELSKIFGCSAMSVTRAYKALTDCDLFHFENEGKNKYILPNSPYEEIPVEAEKFLINPVSKVVYTKDKIENSLKSGIYALSEKGMLNVAKKDIAFAIDKRNKPDTADLISKDEYLLNGGYKTELWLYNPKLLSGDDTVDDISLILTLKDLQDERVQIELDELRRKYKW